MAFWGIEVKPGKPYVHRYDNEGGRLHISQATLGSGSSTTKSKVQCNVGDKSPIYLCSLLPERLETCALNLEFEEEDEVTFSVIGPHSVHLSGFFYGENDQDKLGDDSGSDSYEENIMGIDSEDEDNFMNYDSEDEDEEGDFIDDDDDDDDLVMYPASPVPNSGVRIEEIFDDEKPVNENGVSKLAKKKKGKSNVSDDKVNSDQQLVVKGEHDVPVVESEDDDGFPVSASRQIKDNNADEEVPKKKPKGKTEASKNLKRKIDAGGRDGEYARENDTPNGSSDPTDNASQNDAQKKKKNKKKKVTKEDQQTVVADSNDAEQLLMAEMENDLKETSVKKKEKKKKNKQNRTQEIATNTIADQIITDQNGSTLEKEEKQEAKPLQVRTYPNGLVIEELAMNKPDGKRASPGKKVSVHYIGKLKNGKIFDSNIGKAPFKFRLGIGQVIKGWDVGVNGMRIGDRRRLTIPPAMGYGAKGAGGTIPPNSWLVFDVELVDVN